MKGHFSGLAPSGPRALGYNASVPDVPCNRIVPKNLFLSAQRRSQHVVHAGEVRESNIRDLPTLINLSVLIHSGHGSAGTRTPRHRVRILDGGAGSDHASGSRAMARYSQSSPSSKGSPAGTSPGQVGACPASESGWVGRQQRLFTLRKSGNCAAPASANQRSPAA